VRRRRSPVIGGVYRTLDPQVWTISHPLLTRAHLETQGNTIIANLGDQYSELEDGRAERGFTLPNPVYFVK
jgi:hypothetical protein